MSLAATNASAPGALAGRMSVRLQSESFGYTATDAIRSWLHRLRIVSCFSRVSLLRHGRDILVLQRFVDSPPFTASYEASESQNSLSPDVLFSFNSYECSLRCFPRNCLIVMYTHLLRGSAIDIVADCSFKTYAYFDRNVEFVHHGYSAK
jgi:hypothetical protein